MGEGWNIRWSVREDDLEGLTPAKARDILVLAFLATRGEAVARVDDWGIAGPTPIELAVAAESIVRGKFDTLGYDWDMPSAAEIVAVTEALAEDVASWGTPPEVIEQHLGQMRSVHERLADEPRR